MAKLQGNDAALVAAAITQAEASLLAGKAAAGALPKFHPSQSATLVRALYQGNLDFILGYDPATGEGGITHDPAPREGQPEDG